MFTIIVPTHDRPELLHRALQSLVNQTFKQFDVIIVSDSGAYIPPYGDLSAFQGRYAYVIHSFGRGPATSRNMGLDLVNTEYVMFLDDDDAFEPGHLASLAQALPPKALPDKIHFCDFKVVEEDRRAKPPLHISTKGVIISGVTKADIYVRNRIPNSCLIYPANLAKNARFDAEIILYEDWDYLLQCLARSELSYVPTESVLIHKSYAPGADNLRRGNSNDSELVSVMMTLYRRFPSPNSVIRAEREKLFRDNGVTQDLSGI